MAQKKTRKKRSNTVLLLVLAVLIVVVGMEIVNVYGCLRDVRAQEAALTQQMEEKTQENEALRSDLSKKDDPDFIKGLARDLLGLAEEGERIFYDVNDGVGWGTPKPPPRGGGGRFCCHFPARMLYWRQRKEERLCLRFWNSATAGSTCAACGTSRWIPRAGAPSAST